MNSFLKVAGAFAFGATALGAANAADVPVSGDITVDTTWTADNQYELVDQVIVRPGATLTIEAGTVIASDGGSLAVAKGAQIFVNGTAKDPVIMTSKNDVATWTDGDSTSGVYRQAANEWGNLTICGSGYISENATPGNTATPSAANVAEMEGLVDDGTGFTLYGGGDDNDDSGSINYLSLRYGGRVIGLNNELNGLSLGGIGRGTDISYVEIMNNVDDGIEIWGGTVQLDHYSIWNIGDDSFDCDQGWRGKAQFGLIVQGYSVEASQGSGVGDNAYEIDGAEDSDWQPRTRATIYNTTVLGNPLDGDGLTTWRDGAGVQYRNSIFMNGGEAVVKNDIDDGDGASGYGHNGTATLPTLFATPATTYPAVNKFATPAEEAAAYTAQVDGNVSELRGSVFFQNFASSAYTNFNAYGANVGFDNIVEPANSPIRAFTFGPQFTSLAGTGSEKDVLPYVSLDPRAANDALTAPAIVAPADGFFEPAAYRGAFDADNNWLTGWSAADAFGFLVKPVVEVSGDITTDVVWTAGNTYNLVDQVVVRPGASLCIEAGTVVASDAGSLAVARGAQIFVEGTAAKPVVMTSLEDQATWTNGDPSTGLYRQAANEWGNLTIMGSGYISENATPGNTATPSAANVAEMEGLVDDGTGFTLYGGGDDNDDSGSINYLSLRYGGRVIGLNNELNGLSLGGIGRGTDISYVEIMNNVDDGIEIWGGTVQLDHYSIWNIGDDSFDCDQGWRGKAQFGLIVQGYSVEASQGSGVGDNAYEIDGAEDSDWQPRTRATIYNTTVLGNPLDGDGLTTWRDGAGVQYRNSIFMNGGEAVVKNDIDDGDGASGYGHNGTATLPTLFATPATTYPAVNKFATPAEEAAAYTAQVDGNVSELRGSVFFQNFASSAYTNFNAYGANVGFDNIVEPANSPIAGFEFGAQFTSLAGTGSEKDVLPYSFIDPRAANDALTVPAIVAPADGFFEAAAYRGAFDATTNWAEGWTAADAFGFFCEDGTATLATAANVIPGSLTATAPNLGETLTFTVDSGNQCGVGPGSPFLIFIAPGGQIAFPFGEGGCGFFTPSTVLLNPLTLDINLSLSLTGGGVGLYLGAPVAVNVPIPDNIAFKGAVLTTQVAFFENSLFTLRLGEGQVLSLGK